VIGPPPPGHPVHSFPILTPGGASVAPASSGRRGGGRRLPQTPNKPSTLHLASNQQFPHRNTTIGLPPTGSGKLPVPPVNANINFPKLNASPTHGPNVIKPSDMSYYGSSSTRRSGVPLSGSSTSGVSAGYNRYEEPLSFEQAMAIGRGGGILLGGTHHGRQLPSPVPNGYKPGCTNERLLTRGTTRNASDPMQRRNTSTTNQRNSDSDDEDWC
jgi:hypothetical protein